MIFHSASSNNAENLIQRAQLTGKNLHCFVTRRNNNNKKNYSCTIFLIHWTLPHKKQSVHIFYEPPTCYMLQTVHPLTMTLYLKQKQQLNFFFALLFQFEFQDLTILVVAPSQTVIIKCSNRNTQFTCFGSRAAAR